MAESYDSKTISELLGLLAHDLRNPLSAMHSNLGFVSSSIDSSQHELHEALRDALISCEGLAHLIDNLEILGRGLILKAVSVQPTILAPIVNDQLTKCRSMADSHGVALMLVKPAPGGLRVVTSPEMLACCISNLIRGAIQYAGKEPVRVAVSADGSACRIEIQDDGSPLAPELRELVFTPQGQLHAKGGSGIRYARGLGLLCAKLCADIAGARIEAGERAAGKGVAFGITLPVA